MSEWAEDIAGYRAEEPIAHILSVLSQSRFVIDESIHSELQTYFLFINRSDTRLRTVCGPADYSTLVEILNDLQPAKDRVGEIMLISKRIYNDLSLFQDIVRAHLYTKERIIAAKNDAIRQAVCHKTVPELERVMSKVKAILDSAEIVHKNCNQTYNICNTMSSVIKEMVYFRNLAEVPTQPTREKIHKNSI